MGTRITRKGQVTIPVEIRQAAHAPPGTELEWSYDPATARIIATKAGHPERSFEERLARFRGTAKRGLSTDEIMALTRGD